MAALSVSLIDVSDDRPVRSTLSQGAEQHTALTSEAIDGILDVEDPPSVVPAFGDANLVSVGPSALRTMQLGAEGPAGCTTRMWLGAFTIGMLGGVWAGLTLLPALRMPLAGGWFSCGCIMAIPLFRLALQAVRVHIADGGFVSQVLSASVSPQCSDAVDRLVMVIQLLQALFVVTQAFLYCAGAVMAMNDPNIRPDMVISMLVGMIALLVGSFQVAAMIVSVIASCEVLHDCCRQLSLQTAEATTAEQLHAVYLRMRELDQTLQRAVIALRPIVLSVSQK